MPTFNRLPKKKVLNSSIFFVRMVYDFTANSEQILIIARRERKLVLKRMVLNVGRGIRGTFL